MERATGMDGSLAILPKHRPHAVGRLACRLRRNHVGISTHLKRSLVLAYAFPEDELRPLLYPHLQLDTFEGHGFLAVAMVETTQLRPTFLPAWMGIDFFLVGYRIFVRYRTHSGKNLRGLQILRSECDSHLMNRAGNLLTPYRYRPITPAVEVSANRLRVRLAQGKSTTLDVTARLDEESLPEGSVFADAKEARRFEGPMPFTFSYEPETGSMVRVEGIRTEWNPKLVGVEVATPPDLGSFGLNPDSGRLASAFYLENVSYRWKRGVTEKVD